MRIKSAKAVTPIIAAGKQSKQDQMPDIDQPDDGSGYRKYGVPLHEMTPHVRTALASMARKIEQLEARLMRERRRTVELENMADEDPLLPVLNRRAFVRELARTLSYKERYGAPVSFIFLDIDGFKAINDGFGHDIGDEILRHISRFLISNVRKSDIVGRLGGDEFGIVLMQASEAQALDKARKIIRQISETPVLISGLSVGFSVSAGVSEACDGDDAQMVITRADKKMYEQKDIKTTRAPE